jgi:two-component system NtrC family response regulator
MTIEEPIMANILIIDDDKAICDMLSLVVKEMGHEAASASTLHEGTRRSDSGWSDVVLLDVNLPDGNGLDALPRIRQSPSSPEVIIVTGAGDPDGAELAIKNGAWDYIQKPLLNNEVTLQLSRAIQYREEKQARTPPVALKREGIIGSGPRMQACLDLLAEAAHSDANVLVMGETGTGKELFATAIHENCSRAGKSFVVVDCAALPDTLVESVIFGHEKGAYTGADKAQEGLIRQAHEGTLFLDEVGELPLPVQKAFLRVLQERRFRPVGGKREVESHFRLIAATNRDLEHMVGSGQFRKDFLFRLRSMTIELPPLREHLEDIKELVVYYMTRLCDSYGIATKGFSPDFFQTLRHYHWPGNVRELVSTVERALASAYHDPTLFPKHLPTHMRVALTRKSVSKSRRNGDGSMDRTRLSAEFSTFRDFREAGMVTLEQQYLNDLMLITDGNIKEACRLSGLSRSRLYGLLKKHQIAKPA